MVAMKEKRINNELLHIFLVITLLRNGNDNRFYRQSPVISTNFFNDVSVSNDIMGPSWAYSRTSFHHQHFYHDPPIHEIKTLDSGNYYDTGVNDVDSEYGDDDFDIDLNIINQLRSLTLSRFNSLPRLGKNEPNFQDITAYLLSESTSPSNAASPPSTEDGVEYDTPIVSPAQQNHQVEITELSPESLLSPVIDSGHEETGDDGDAHSTDSESVKEFPLEVTTGIPRNSERRESYGFHSDSDEEIVGHELLMRSAEPHFESEVKTEPIDSEDEELVLPNISGVDGESFVVKPEVKEESNENDDVDWEKLLFEELDNPIDLNPDDVITAVSHSILLL